MKISEKRCAVMRLSNDALGAALTRKIAEESGRTAEVLLLIAEFDERKLYRDAGHPSMISYCMHALNLSKSAAHKRIWVARKARRFPVIFDLVAEGRIHLSGMLMLTKVLTQSNVHELLQAAERKTCDEIEILLASKFPRPDVPTRITPLTAVTSPAIAMTCTDEVSARKPGESEAGAGIAVELTLDSTLTASVPNAEPASRPVMEPPAPPARVTPLAPERHGIQFTISQETRDLLQEAQDLMGFEIAPNDLAGLFHRSLEALIAERRKRKFGATTRPRAAGAPPEARSAVNAGANTAGVRRASSNVSRYIPAHVKRIVESRDQGQCTFVGPNGRRCPSRIVEFDHVQEFARGGDTSAANLRLRCRAHNQLAAEATFGAEFMEAKRGRGKSGEGARRAI